MRRPQAAPIALRGARKRPLNRGALQAALIERRLQAALTGGMIVIIIITMIIIW